MPENFDDLKSLRGVGNKTASVVTCVALGGNALPVDTHVFRLAHRLGLSDGKTPDAVMNDLKAEFPEKAGMTCITRSFFTADIPAKVSVRRATNATFNSFAIIIMKTYEIKSKKQFSEKVNEYVVYAPDVAHRARAGQFIILRATEDGERVPFTVCDYDREKGTITILVQTVGYSTMILEKLSVGDSICDFVGPLGKPTDLSGFDKILLVGGGIGSAVIYPQAKQLMLENKAADVIVGARNESLVIYENDFKKFQRVFVMTDDGSAGEKGFVTDKIKNLLDEGRKYDCIFAVGPLPMMKAVCALTKNYGVKTIVSMNTIMVDGTGMCGSCRLTVDGKVKYACVDGPEFDGHLVDFDEAINRSKFYKEQEKEHVCRLTGEIR